jgi:hypothetical protein
MMFRLREMPSPVVRPRVTPDPLHAAELERRFSELAYRPENGFHRDRRQVRHARTRLVLVPK